MVLDGESGDDDWGKDLYQGDWVGFRAVLVGTFKRISRRPRWPRSRLFCDRVDIPPLFPRASAGVPADFASSSSMPASAFPRLGVPRRVADIGAVSKAARSRDRSYRTPLHAVPQSFSAPSLMSDNRRSDNGAAVWPSEPPNSRSILKRSHVMPMSSLTRAPS